MKGYELKPQQLTTRDEILKHLGRGTADSEYWDKNIISTDEENERLERILDIVEFASQDDIRWVLSNEHWSVKAALARKEDCSEDILMILGNDTDGYVRQSVAGFAALSFELIGMLYNDDNENVRESLSENEIFNEFLENVSGDINKSRSSVSSNLVYDYYKGALFLVYDDAKHTVRKVDFDLEKKVMNIYSTKNEKEVVGVFDLNTKKMVDLRPSKNINKEITQKHR